MLLFIKCLTESHKFIPVRSHPNCQSKYHRGSYLARYQTKDQASPDSLMGMDGWDRVLKVSFLKILLEGRLKCCKQKCNTGWDVCGGRGGVGVGNPLLE